VGGAVTTGTPERLQAFTDAIVAHDRPLASFTRMCLAARRMNTTQTAVEDVLSDAYIAAATRLRHDRNLQVEDWVAWFRRFVFLTCLRHTRDTLKDKTIDLGTAEMEERLLDFVADRESSNKEDTRLIVAQALERLKVDDPQSHTIVERSADGYTSVEIAKTLGLTPENVRTQKSRALRKLREELEGIRK
jgi:RNA polymerase sigma factor (sigma-70 family)